MQKYLAELAALLRLEWPRNRAVNIVCHGHSVPAGYFQTPVVDTFNAYPHLLHRRLKERFPHAVVNVIVTAIGGEDSMRGAERFARDVLCHHPDLVTIDYALNDRRAGLEAAGRAWTSMIQAAQASAVRLILLTPTADTAARLDDPEDPLNRHAAQVRALAAHHGVALADSLASFQACLARGVALADLMSQPNHPNRAGHDLAVDELMKLFPEPASPAGH